jgi:hypothetical protein
MRYGASHAEIAGELRVSAQMFSADFYSYEGAMQDTGLRQATSAQ